MKQYALTTDKSKGQIIYRFNDQDQIIGFDLEMELNAEQRAWFFNHFPFTFNDLEAMARKFNTFQVCMIPTDLSFEAFWDAYAHKVGKKDRASRLWNALSDSEKGLAIAGIRPYDQWLSKRTIEKKYPETYLSNRTWENEFSK